MDFSEIYLKENYEKCCNEALNAKAKGNISLAKKKFDEAADFLERLTVLATGDIKKTYQERIIRLRTIAKNLKVDETKKPLNNSNTNKSILGIEEYDTEINDDISQFVTLYNPSDLEFGFEGVIGLDKAKEAINEYVINPIKYSEAYNYNFMDNKAILLYGPPGTGKTTFAKAVAKEINQPFFLINMSGLINAYIGETAKNIDKIFDYLRAFSEDGKKSMVVFFDELDEIAKKRGSEDKTSEAAVPALLRNLDGVKKNKGFMILANTNYMELLDDALLNRFRRRIFIPLPDLDSRLKLFNLQFKEVEKEYLDIINLNEAAKEADTLSGRDIAYIADDFKRILSKLKAGLIKDVDLNLELLKLISTRKK